MNLDVLTFSGHNTRTSELGPGFKDRVFNALSSPLLYGSLSRDIPPHMQQAVGFWHTLAPEFQKNIFYFQRKGEWCARIAGHIVSMQNEIAEKTNKEDGIYVGEDATYFSPDAAAKRAETKSASIPSEKSWIAMANSVGGWRVLVQLLSLPFAGVYSVNRGRWYGDDKKNGNDLGVIRHDVQGRRYTVLHTGTITTPFTVDPITEKKIPVENAKQYSFLYVSVHDNGPLLSGPESMMTYDAAQRGCIVGKILRDSHTPHVYWNCLRLAYK